MDSESEFCEILKFLVDNDLVVLYHVLMMDEKEQSLRKMRDQITYYSQLYNAYCARTLVSNPAEYVKNEMLLRFASKIEKIN